MRKNIEITEGIYPMPVLMIATYNQDNSVNVMNAAWGTMQDRNIVALNLGENHKTVENIKARGAFTVQEITFLKNSQKVVYPHKNPLWLMPLSLMNFQFVWNVNSLNIRIINMVVVS